MTLEWNGIERRLERLKGCLLKPEPLKAKRSDEFASDPYLKDAVYIIETTRRKSDHRSATRRVFKMVVGIAQRHVNSENQKL